MRSTSGDIINLGNLSSGQEIGGYTSTNTTFTTNLEKTWTKQYLSGESWVNKGGTHVTSVSGHSSHENFCPIEATPTPTPYWGIFVECIDIYEKEGYMVRFGYKWDGEGSLELNRSDLNPGNASGDLPSTFTSGRHLFDIYVNGFGNEVWTVSALGKTKTTTASSSYGKLCSAKPTPTPSINPTPTPSPTTTPDPKAGKHSSLGNSNPTCDNLDFEVTYDLRENGEARKDVEVTITYKGNKQTLKTNDTGTAKVFFTYSGEGRVEADNNSGYPAQSLQINNLDCPSVGGAVLGASSDTQTSGQVLGDSTSVLAATGTFSSTLALAVRMIFGFVSGLALFESAKSRKLFA
ncbi:MAG: hypothetical protein ACOX6V_05995 [Patescibacteria group bacterium]